MKYHTEGVLAYENGVGYHQFPKQYKANPGAKLEWQAGWKDAESMDSLSDEENETFESAFNEVFNV